MAARPVTSMISTARDNKPRRRHWCARKATLTSFPSSIASESLANLLIEKRQNSLGFFRMSLKLKAEQVDFDSAIPRFESWRPAVRRKTHFASTALRTSSIFANVSPATAP
jgi:hypothetical protein